MSGFVWKNVSWNGNNCKRSISGVHLYLLLQYLYQYHGPCAHCHARETACIMHRCPDLLRGRRRDRNRNTGNRFRSRLGHPLFQPAFYWKTAGESGWDGNKIKQKRGKIHLQLQNKGGFFMKTGRQIIVFSAPEW